MLRTGAGWLLIGGLLALLVWSIVRARKGYVAVQSLMAQVEAQASAEAHAQASNVVNLGFGAGRPEPLDLRELPALSDEDFAGLLAAMRVEAVERRASRAVES